MDNAVIEKVSSLVHDIDYYFQLNDSSLRELYTLSGSEQSTFKVTSKRTIDSANEVKSRHYRFYVGKRLSNENEVRRLVGKILSTTSNLELDLCYIEDSLGNCNIFQIHGYGTSLCPALISEQLLHKIKNPEYMLETDLERLNAVKNMAKNYLPNKEPKELSEFVVVFGRRYNYNDGNFIPANVKSTKKFTFPSYCKFYIRLGYCSNPNCKRVHDPRTKSFCRTLASKGKCNHSNCKLSHQINEFNASDDMYSQIRNGTCKEHILYSHELLLKKHSLRNYPICRPFAYLGYCFRGSSCKFPHFYYCPEFYCYGVCNMSKCPLQHVRSDAQITPLQNIPLHDYLLPPLCESEGTLNNGRWLGLFNHKKSVEDRIKGTVSIRNNFNIQITTSSDEENDDNISDATSNDSWNQSVKFSDDNLNVGHDYIPLD